MVLLPLKFTSTPHLTIYILEAFAKPLGIGDCHVNVFVDVISLNLVYVVVVLGLVDSVSIIYVGLKSI